MTGLTSLQSSPIAPLDSSRLRIRRSTELRPVTWLDNPPTGFGSAATDHMLTVRWNVATGWADPEIIPYGDLTIPPTASCLHYATQCFEGMKAFRGYDGRLRLFRPDRNCQRLRASSSAVSLPSFETQELERLIVALLAVDGPRWLPQDTCRGKSMYIRPALIADGPQIGVRLPEDVLLFVIIVPWPDISVDAVEKGLNLITSRTDSVRAWPGGYGSVKIGANYGPSFLSLGEARAMGFDQVLWLLGEESIVTEAGASNFFIIWKNSEGIVELVTAPLDDKVILPGVTRDSVLNLARERLEGKSAEKHGQESLVVVERRFTMDDIQKAHDEGRLVEAFVSGTAYFITPISHIQWRETHISIPNPATFETSYAMKLRKWIHEIMYGEVQHPWAVEVNEIHQNGLDHATKH